jgi:hypothetical protein
MIFISYSRKDSKYVTLLVNICKAEKINFYIDIHNINFGEKWLPALEKAISESEKFYLFWSKNSNKSEFVQKEIELVNKKDDPVIIPIILDRTPLPEKVSEYNGFEYVKNEYDELRKVEKSKNFYKISTYVLSIALIALFLSTTFNSNSLLYNNPSGFETYEQLNGEDTRGIEKDNGNTQAADSTISLPTIAEDEMVHENQNNFILSPEFLSLLLVIVITYLFVNYRIKRSLFNTKVKEFINHI